MVDCDQNCGKSYCAMCLWNRYGIKQIVAQRSKKWECPYCLKTCNCAACLRKRGVDPKEHEVLATYKALLEISVVIPPAFARNSDSVAGVCDSAPKPARSQGNYYFFGFFGLYFFYCIFSFVFFFFVLYFCIVVFQFLIKIT